MNPNNPPGELVLLTCTKINNYLKSQNQTESYISELWVLQALKSHLEDSFVTGLNLSYQEISDRICTIAARRIAANIATIQRHKNEWRALSSRPTDSKNTNFGETEVGQVQSRGEISLRKQRYDGAIGDRHINIK